MATTKFKTTLKSAEEFNRLKEHLKNISGIDDCSLENNSPGGNLIINSNGLSVDAISREIFKAGFRNEPVKSNLSKLFGKVLKKECCRK